LQNNVHSYIYPNPFGGELFINDVPEQSRYVITNILGMPISSGVVQQSRTQLNTYHWPSGMYIVSIITPDGNREVVKVLK
jgi:Secretion system C-terminal sorting domain